MMGKVPESMFSEILGKVWLAGMKMENILTGFRTTGILPVDKNKFPLSEFDPVELNTYLRIEAMKQNNMLHSSIVPSNSNYENVFIEPSTPNYKNVLIELSTKYIKLQKYVN